MAHPLKNIKSNPKKKTVGKYELGKTLGEGTFGKVKFGIHMETKQEVAIKILDKQKIKQNKMGLQIKREVSIMKKMVSSDGKNANPYVVQLYEVLASKTKIYLVLELVKGGELFDKIVKETRLQEPKARYYLKQLVQGVECCHEVGVCHRDLKPENLLLDAEDNIKISDFGLSALYSAEARTEKGWENKENHDDNIFLSTSRANLLHTTCGTPNYVAPEVLEDQGYDGRIADIWSIGVILYVLVSGCLPFDEMTLPALFSKIQNAEYSIPSFLSAEVQDLIEIILVADPKTRATISQIKKHPWYCNSREDDENCCQFIGNDKNIEDNREGNNLGICEKEDVMYSQFDQLQPAKEYHLPESSADLQRKRELHLASQATEDDFFVNVQRHLGEMGFNIEHGARKNKIKAFRSTPRGMISLTMVLKSGDDGDLSINIWRRRGGIMEYNKILDELLMRRMRQLFKTF